MDEIEKWMQRALDLAEKGRGYTSPNPVVGAVLVKNNRVVGEGYHTRFGATHAEVVAIQEAGAAAYGATLYVNLEPCTYEGKTPPCVDAIIAAGVRKVVIGMIDPNPKVNGSGVRRLNAAGIQTRVGILEQACRRINRGFAKYIGHNRPWITLKMALTADGYIADVSGKSQWITSTDSRRFVREQRRRHDAIMIGMGTVFKDNPSLLPDNRQNFIPFRIILDDVLNIPYRFKLVSDQYKERTVILTVQQEKQRKVDHLERMGINILQVPADDFGWIDLPQAMRYLADFGITSIYCEGGGQVAGSLINYRLMDELQLFVAPKIIGEGISPFGGFIKPLDSAVQLDWTDFRQMGADVLLKGQLR